MSTSAALSAAMFLAVCALVAAVPAGAADLYRSNAVGIQGERLDPADPERPEYVLEVSFTAGTEVRSLQRDGQEVRRTEVTRDGATSTSRVYEDDVLERQTVARSDGEPVEETFYSDGSVSELWQYHYDGPALVRRDAYGPDGELIYHETYAYWRDGSLRSTVREQGSDSRTEYRYRHGRLEEEWVSRPGESERFEFDTAGRLAVRERFAGDELQEQEVRIYTGPQSDALLQHVIVSAGDDVTRRDYDDHGRLVTETVEQSSVVTRKLTRVFRDDLLVSETETEGGGVKRWDYAYDENGERTQTSYREDGELVEVETIVLGPDAAPADRMTELYHRGEPVLRVYYDGQLRLREEVIRDGEVVRVREFSSASGGSDQ